MLPRLNAKAIPPQVRTYAMSVSPARVYPGKRMPRAFSVRKTFLYNQYTALLNRDTPVLFLTHSNLSAKQLIKLRRDIAGVRPSTTPPSPSPSPSAPERPTLTVVNTGLLGAALRAHPTALARSPAPKRALARLVTPGALAALALPPLDPPQLAALLRVLDRALPPRAAAPAPSQAQAAVENATPGRRPKRVRAAVPGALAVRGALLDGRVLVGARELREHVARLPTLGALHAQIVGLVGAPAARLAGVVGEAAGGRLAGTLDGFRRGLEAGAGARE